MKELNRKGNNKMENLTVVPQEIDAAIKYLKKNSSVTFEELYYFNIIKEDGMKWLNNFQMKDERFGVWGLNNKLFILAYLAITGYKVEK